MRVLKSFISRLHRIDSIESRLAYVQEALGRIEARQTMSARTLRDAEFRVFSQWGEDGIIQFLLRQILIENKTFVEFGVQDYLEANTRFLLVNDNWSGLVIDGSADNIDKICGSALYWQRELQARCAFITAENINDLIREAELKHDLGLLSVDVDGNDYWIWRAIDVVSPRIVIVEYNSRFGPEREITVPYDSAFVRKKAHPSMIYYGASLAALARLGEEKGYSLLGCNSAGNNAFFVRKDVQPSGLPTISVKDAYVAAKFRESRDAAGRLNFLSYQDEQKILDALPLVDLRK